MVHQIYERSFARFRALASDTSIIGDCDDQIDDSKEQAEGSSVGGMVGGVFTNDMVSGKPPP